MFMFCLAVMVVFVFMQNHQGGFLWIDDYPMDRARWLRNDEDNLDFEAPMAGHYSVVSSVDGPQYHGGNEDSVVVGSAHLSMLSPCWAYSKLTIIFGFLIVIISIVIMLG
jgi:hypothetical protein